MANYTIVAQHPPQIGIAWFDSRLRSMTSQHKTSPPAVLGGLLRTPLPNPPIQTPPNSMQLALAGDTVQPSVKRKGSTVFAPAAPAARVTPETLTLCADYGVRFLQKTNKDL